MRKNFAPFIVALAILVVPPVLYVGSYLALVTPGGVRIQEPAGYVRVTSYRIDNRLLGQAFWPLEKIDRKVRPGEWRKQLVWYMLCPTSPL